MLYSLDLCTDNVRLQGGQSIRSNNLPDTAEALHFKSTYKHIYYAVGGKENIEEESEL